MRINQVKAGSILSYVQMALGIAVEIIYVPFIVKILGQSEYGLYTTVNSSIAMLSILNLGFASGYIKYYSKYKKEENFEKISKLNGLFVIVFSIMGLIAFVCGIYLSMNLDIVFSNGLTSEEYEIAKILTILLAVNLAISFPMTVFSSIISAHEKFVFLKVAGMLKTIGGPIVTLPILLLGYRSIAMVMVTLIVSLVVDVLNCYYVVVKLKCKFVFHDFEEKLLKNIVVYTSFIAINLIVDQINSNIDNVVLARFKGTREVAIYAVGMTLYNCYKRFSTSVSSVFTPRVHGIVNKYDKNKTKLKQELTELFTRVGRIQFLILGLVVTGFIFFGQSFLHYWVGDEYYISYYVALLLIIPSTIPLIQNIGIEIQRAEYKHRFRSITYLIMAILNLVLSIYLAQEWGAVGSTLGTAISLVVANGLIINVYYHKSCYIDVFDFWKNILNEMKGIVLPVVCGIFIHRFWVINSIFVLLVQIFLFSIIYFISMWFFGMNPYERSLVSNVVKSVKRKLK